MDGDRFWEIIDACFSEAGDGLAALERRLRDLPRSEVVAFQIAMNAVMARAYTWELIAAACFVGSGQSDDGFEDFRAWLISQGRETFERVVASPEMLADLPYHESPIEEWGLEELHMLPGEVGGEEDDPDWPYSSDPDAPTGAPIELQRESLRAGFPKLWNRFSDRFMIITS